VDIPATLATKEGIVALAEALGRLRDALAVPRLGDDPSGEHRQV
jgi:hypothetical protein